MILDMIKFKVDIFDGLERICNFQYKIAILDQTLQELKNKKHEKLALQIINKKNVQIIKTQEGYVDNLLVNLDENYIVATNDKGLKRRLRKINKPIITLRQKKYLITENVL
jgi:rRNA-processing protein FCF1